MKFCYFILFLGVSSALGIAPSLLSWGNYIWLSDDGTLRGVAAVPSIRHINLSFQNIRSVVETALEGIKHTKSLNLSNNRLEELLPLTFSKMTQLEILSLAHNKIQSINRAFVGLRKLKHLNLSNNLIKSVRRGDFFGLTKSVHINIRRNDFNTLSSGAFGDPSVPVIEFEDKRDMAYWAYFAEILTPVEPLPEDFVVKIGKTDEGLVTAVRDIKRYDRRHHWIIATVIHSERKLKLSHLDLKTFQRGWYQVPGNHIEKLDLSNNLIANITEELFNRLPSSMTSFDLRYNKIVIIRRDVINNRHLRELYLGYNPLSTIEANAFGGTNLTSFSVINSKLNSLTFVKTLPRTVEKFHFSFNPISSIPVDTFRGCKNLKVIDLSWNGLKIIEPGTFEDQENLVSLRLDSNWIQELTPEMFRGLTMIGELSFVDNMIEKIAEDTFSELRDRNGLRIYLTHNLICWVQNGSFSDMNITAIDLSYNRIAEQSITRGAFNNSLLYDLELSNNPIKKINSESFDGILGSYRFSFNRNKIAIIEKGDAEYLKNVRHLYLYNTPLKFLENGALYGLSKDKDVLIHFQGSPIKVIRGGLFDDV